MSKKVNEYDDLLDGTEHRWRNRLIGLVVLAALVAAGGYALWAVVLSGGGSAAEGVQTATVEKGSISKTVSTSGVAAAQSTASLSFGQSGRVSAVNVTLGQEVKQGDVLAEIESDELQSAVTTAEVNLASAQSKLDDLLKGPTASDLASADQSLMQAQGNLDQANRALEDLMNGPSESELRSAEQAVASAQSQLIKAQTSRTDLYSASDDAVAAAEDAVTKAEDALANAKRTAANAADSLVMAKISLLSAAATYCDTEDHLTLAQICGSSIHVPLTDSTVHQLTDSISDELTASGEITAAGAVSDDVQQGPEPTPEPTVEPTPEPTAEVASGSTASGDIVKAATSLISANTSYKNAQASKSDADSAVESAEAAIETAKNDLAEAKKGPSSADIASADVAVASAQLSLDQANEQLAELKAGPTQDDLDDAQRNIDVATAGLVVAQAKRDDVYDGTDSSDIDLQREQVRQAELSVEQARKNLDKAQIIATLDGTVAALTIEVGEEVSAGGADAAITLNTPDALRLDMTISESDVLDVEVGQSGIALFDAVGERPFPIVITSVGTNPTTTQGVITYKAQASIVTELPTGAAGMRPSGASPRGAALAGSPVPGGTPPAGIGGLVVSADTSAKPLPGMNASVTITVAQAQDVLTVPSQAIQTEGFRSVVEVQKDDGSTEKVAVQTGLTDGTNTEITQGLEEGQTIIIATRAATSAQATQTAGFQRGSFTITEGGPEGGGPSFRSEGSAP
ncbi:MAG: biotin/lipoyl-binding protein [Dehalococcoidia bacterium]|nr:biotin/lipoyl-binding protein [Dehalococcoidia bacterium]